MNAHDHAFPFATEQTMKGNMGTKEGEMGMTLRTYIATQAMAQLIPLWHSKRPFATEVAENAVKYADALIAELSKP